MRYTFELLKKSRTFKYGVPFFAIIIGGSLGLEQFAKLRYEYRRAQLLPRELEKAGIVMKRPEDVSLEKEFEKLEKMDIDNWENIRGPRPWEEKF